MDYKIVYGETIEALEKAVNAHVKKGYTPCGGVVIEMGIMYQAIFKE